MFYVYILKSLKDGSYYIGYTQDIESRISKHNLSNKGYSATKKPWILVYSEKFENKTLAIKRENFLKAQKSKVFIERLISSSEG